MIIMKKLIAIICAALLVMIPLALVSCGEKESGGIQINKDTGTVDDGTRTVKNLAGESVKIPASVTKVVSLSPSATIILAGLGETGKLVGVDSVSAGVEGVTASTTDASAAASLGAEVAFVSAGADTSALTAAGTVVFEIGTPESMIGVKDIIRLVAAVVGKTDAGESLVTAMTNSINVSQLSTSGAAKSSVYLDLGDNTTTGSGTYLAEALSAAGATSIFADKTGIITVTDEEIIAANPEFIFTTGSASDFSGDEWAGVSAVANGYVYEIDPLFTKYASHNISAIVSAVFEKISDTK
jgi:ABC-type Fe3+-hydroxamate transport system substrate-binding protein